MKKKLLAVVCSVIFAGALFCLTGCGSDDSSESPVAEAPTGTYTGITDDGVQEFLGIRYAAETERWKAPTDVTTTTEDEIDATEWGPCCTQPYDEVEIASQGELSEDDLNLNIWTKDVETEDKPVFVYIHGGGFMNGGSHDPMYEGDNMVRNLSDGEDMVFVSINYRTNIFGSLDLSVVDGYTDEYSDAINLWMLDQIQALKWINENIEAFGGDPENITVCGQSCGGMAISYMLANEDATQYFQKAIIESGAPFIASTTKEQKEEVTELVCDTLGVDNMEDLLAVSADDINEKCLPTVFESLQGLSDIYADGEIIPTDWWDRIREGSAEGIKVMIGSCSGENDWAAYGEDGVVEDEMDIWNTYVVGDSEKKGSTDSKYLINPVDENGDPALDLDAFLATDDDKVKAMTDLYNDMCYIQGTEYEAEALSEYTDTYLYDWTYAQDAESVAEYCEENGYEAETSPFNRPMHSMGMLFALGNLEDGYPELSGDPDTIPDELTEMMQAAYYNFAKNGDPNNDLIPEWKTYDTTDRNTMVMGETWSCEKDPRQAQREAFTCRPQGEK